MYVYTHTYVDTDVRHREIIISDRLGRMRIYYVSSSRDRVVLQSREQTALPPVMAIVRSTLNPPENFPAYASSVCERAKERNTVEFNFH